MTALALYMLLFLLGLGGHIGQVFLAQVHGALARALHDQGIRHQFGHAAHGHAGGPVGGQGRQGGAVDGAANRNDGTGSQV